LYILHLFVFSFGVFYYFFQILQIQKLNKLCQLTFAICLPRRSSKSEDGSSAICLPRRSSKSEDGSSSLCSLSSDFCRLPSDFYPLTSVFCFLSSVIPHWPTAARRAAGRSHRLHNLPTWCFRPRHDFVRRYWGQISWRSDKPGSCSWRRARRR
jgi:hypothetical protein